MTVDMTPGPIAEPLEHAQRALEERLAPPSTCGRDRLAREHRLDRSPAGDRRASSNAAPAGIISREPVADRARAQDPELAQRAGEAPLVAELLGELHRARRYAASAPSMSTSLETALNVSPSAVRSRACPSSRFARSSIAASPRAAARVATRRASSAAASSSCAIRSAAARRSWTSNSSAGSRRASDRAPSSARPWSRSEDRRSTA